MHCDTIESRSLLAAEVIEIKSVAEAVEASTMVDEAAAVA